MLTRSSHVLLAELEMACVTTLCTYWLFPKSTRMYQLGVNYDCFLDSVPSSRGPSPSPSLPKRISFNFIPFKLLSIAYYICLFSVPGQPLWEPVLLEKPLTGGLVGGEASVCGRCSEFSRDQRESEKISQIINQIYFTVSNWFHFLIFNF